MSKLGGLLAILQVSIVLNFYHRKWFREEIDQIRAKKKIGLANEESKGGTKPLELYSIENFNRMMEELSYLKEIVIQDKKIN